MGRRYTPKKKECTKGRKKWEKTMTIRLHNCVFPIHDVDHFPRWLSSRFLHRGHAFGRCGGFMRGVHW